MLLPWPPLGLRETPVTAIRLLARNSAAACLTVGMVGSFLSVAGRHAKRRAIAPQQTRPLASDPPGPCGIHGDANARSRLLTTLARAPTVPGRPGRSAHPGRTP